MRVSKSLLLAQDRLDEASGAMKTQMQFIRSELTEEENIAQDFTERLVNKMLEAEIRVKNARTQFINHYETIEELPDKELAEISDLDSTNGEYKRMCETAEEIMDRYEVLEKKFRTMSHIMEQNNLGSPLDKREEKSWYNDQDGSYKFGFRTTT